MVYLLRFAHRLISAGQGLHVFVWAFPKSLRAGSPEERERVGHFLDRHCRFLPPDRHRRGVRPAIRSGLLQGHALRRGGHVLFRDHDVELV